MDIKNTRYTEKQKREIYAKVVNNPELATEHTCILAASYNPDIIKFLPIRLINEDLCKKCLKKNGLLLEFVPQEFRNNKLYDVAVNNNAEAISYVPESERLRVVYEVFIKSDKKSFKDLPKQFQNVEIYGEFLNILVHSSKFSKLKGFDISSKANKIIYRNLSRFVISFLRNEKLSLELRSLERKLGFRNVIESGYDKSSQLFFVDEKHFNQNVSEKFSSFDDFYNYLDSNLTEADLTEFDFENIDLSCYNMEGACLSSDLLIRQGKYDSTFYDAKIGRYFKESAFLPALANETQLKTLAYHDEMIVNTLNNQHSYKIYYITDIHLNYKIYERFEKNATYDEIRLFIKNYVKKLISPLSGFAPLIIGGDVSFDFEISKLFYQELRSQRTNLKIVAVLGNHELWNYDNINNMSNTLSVDSVVEKYRKMFEELNIKFLHNDLLIGDKILRETDILEKSEEELKKIISYTNFAIFGTVGFSGYNNVFNAEYGLYGSTITTNKQDLECTHRTEAVYNKLKTVFNDQLIIVLSHMPPSDWSNSKLVRKWIYVYGHTHRNYFEVSDDKTIYADNQIGYKNKNAELKFFLICSQYDIFRYYKDGIYYISKKELALFGRGIGVNCWINFEVEYIVMLKRNGLYMFLIEDKLSGKLFILNGGIRKTLKETDLNYYYDNMVKYSEFAKKVFFKYNEALQKISKIVKQFGGDGNIHGSIVDINFYNHIYLSPEDGRVMPYYSEQKGERQNYETVESLLKEHNRLLYENYTKLFCPQGPVKVVDSNDKSVSSIKDDPSIYKYSYIVKKYQYLFNYGIIRVWDDNLLKNDLLDSTDIKLLLD